MAAMVKELNGLYPELGLEIDDATGKVDNMTDSIYDQIDAIVKSKMAEHLHRRDGGDRTSQSKDIRDPR